MVGFRRSGHNDQVHVHVHVHVAYSVHVEYACSSEVRIAVLAWMDGHVHVATDLDALNRWANS